MLRKKKVVHLIFPFMVKEKEKVTLKYTQTKNNKPPNYLLLRHHFENLYVWKCFNGYVIILAKDNVSPTKALISAIDLPFIS